MRKSINTAEIKRIIALILTLSLLASICILSAFSEGNTPQAANPIEGYTQLTLNISSTDAQDLIDSQSENIASFCLMPIVEGTKTIDTDDTPIYMQNTTDITNFMQYKTNLFIDNGTDTAVEADILDILTNIKNENTSEIYTISNKVSAPETTKVIHEQLNTATTEPDDYNEYYIYYKFVNHLISENSNQNEVESLVKLNVNVSYTVTIPFIIDFGTQSKTIGNTYVAKLFYIKTSNLTLQAGDNLKLSIAPSGDQNANFELSHSSIAGSTVPWCIYKNNAGYTNLEETGLKSSLTSPQGNIYTKGSEILSYTNKTTSADIDYTYWDNALTTLSPTGSAAIKEAYDNVTTETGYNTPFTAVLNRKNIGPAGTYTQTLTFTLTYTEAT